MKFIDNLKIFVKGGNGGNGCISYINLRNNYKRKPNGGDGGNGGNVYIKSDILIESLSHLKNNKIYSAKNGCSGKKNNCSGKSGSNIYINVPIGTKIIDFNNNELVYDLKNELCVLVAKGGKKGFGNNKFKKKKIIKKYNNLGKYGENRILNLRLDLLSDIGIFGCVNSGKSSLFKLLTNNSNIKISNYFFTTKYPNMFKINFNKYSYLNLLDIPGFIYNKKLNIFENYKYLNHLNRCKLLLLVIDISILYNKVNLSKYIKEIFNLLNINNIDNNKEMWIIFNKIDLYRNNHILINNKILFFFKKNNINIKYYIISCLYKNIYINKIIYDIRRYFKI